MVKVKKKKSEIQEVLEVVTFIKDRVIGVEGRLSSVDTQLSNIDKRLSNVEKELLKMRDDVRAVDSKVSGIWNVIDVHAERIKQLEVDMQRLKAKA